MRDIMKSLTEIALAQDTLTLARYSDKLEKQKWQTEMVQSSNTFKELKQRLEELKHQFSRAKNDAKRLRQQASKESPLSDQIREEFDKLPNTIPELDELIATTKAKADANYHTDPKVIENYEERKVKIQNLEQELEQEQQKLKTRQEAIEKLKDAWLPPLEQLVSDIDKSFAKKILKNWGVQVRLNWKRILKIFLNMAFKYLSSLEIPINYISWTPIFNLVEKK